MRESWPEHHGHKKKVVNSCQSDGGGLTCSNALSFVDSDMTLI